MHEKSWMPLMLVVASLFVLLVGPLLTSPSTALRDDLALGLVPAQGRLGEVRVALGAEVGFSGQAGGEQQLAAMRGRRAEAWEELSAALARFESPAASAELAALGAGVRRLEAMQLSGALDEDGYLAAEAEYEVAMASVERLGRWIEAERLLREERIRDGERQGRMLTWMMISIAILSSLVAVGMNENLQSFFRRSESERREKSALLQSAGEGLVGVDHAGRVTFANPIAAAMLGYEVGDLLGWRVADIMERDVVAEDGVERLSRLVEQTIRTGQGQRADRLTLSRQDGGTLPVACGVFPVNEEEEEGRRGAVINFLDITPRRQAELERARLLESEQAARIRAEEARERAHFLADASQLFADSLDFETTLQNLAHLVVTRAADSCLIYLVDEEGGIQRLQPVHADPRAQETLRKQMRLHPPSMKTLIQPVRRALMEGRTTCLPDVDLASLKGVPGDDEHLSVSASVGLRSLVVVPLMSRGRILGAISYGSREPGRLCEPEEVLLAEELANRAALAIDNAELYRRSQEAARAREEVLGVVSHDLRSPLNAVRFGAQALLRHWSPTGGDAERRQVEAISRSADRMARMVADLLDIARIDSRTLSIDPAPADARDLVEESLAAHLGAAEDRGVALEGVAASRLPLVLVDEQRILQVLANVVGNAIRFTPPGGRVVVRTEMLDDERVCFHVSDTGCGVASKDLPRLFDRFWKSGIDRSSTGLGLSIARGIVESHGGTIWAESEQGVGSTFSFTVPAMENRTGSQTKQGQVNRQATRHQRTLRISRAVREQDPPGGDDAAVAV